MSSTTIVIVATGGIMQYAHQRRLLESKGEKPSLRLMLSPTEKWGPQKQSEAAIPSAKKKAVVTGIANEAYQECV